MAVTDVRSMWQRTASHRFQDDTIRLPKLAHCPSLPKTHPETFYYEMVRGDDQAPSYYWSNSWSSLETKMAWQMSPTTLCDQRSDCPALDEFTGSRCLKSAGLQALAAERNPSAKLSSGMTGITSEYATVGELELEWQLIVDPKPKSGLSASFRAAEAEKRNEELKTNEVEDGFDNVPVETIISNLKMNLQGSRMSRSFRESEEASCEGSFSEGGGAESLTQKKQQQQHFDYSLGRYQETRDKFRSYGYQPTFCITGKASPSTVTTSSTSISWRTANVDALVALVAQKAKERLENCDLPTPLSRSIILKGSLESGDLMMDALQPESVDSFDRNVMNSILQARDPNRPERLAIPISSDVLERVESNCNLTGQFARMSLPLNIPTKVQASSTKRHDCQSSSFADIRQASWMGGEKAMSSSSLGKSSGPLVEALCHSQTRAREAEKRAEESFQEYQRLAHLFFREASLSLTYRQRVGSLQAENARLKMSVHRNLQATVWLQPCACSPFSIMERLANARRNTAYGQDHGKGQMRDEDPTASFAISGESGAEMIMSCTLSFAFALGLSLAGAGLILGWSMGWILLAK